MPGSRLLFFHCFLSCSASSAISHHPSCLCAIACLRLIQTPRQCDLKHPSHLDLKRSSRASRASRLLHALPRSRASARRCSEWWCPSWVIFGWLTARRRHARPRRSSDAERAASRRIVARAGARVALSSHGAPPLASTGSGVDFLMSAEQSCVSAFSRF